MTGSSFQPSHHSSQLTPEQLALIGDVMLCWGVAEQFVGAAAIALLGSTSPAVVQFVMPMPFSRKLQLVRSAAGEPTGDLAHALGELAFVEREWKPERDTLAHGCVGYDLSGEVDTLTALGQPVIKAIAKNRLVASLDLARARERANYAAGVAIRAHVIVAHHPTQGIYWDRRPA